MADANFGPPSLSRATSVLFLALLVAPPLVQAAWEISRGEFPGAFEVVGPVEEARLRSFEEHLRADSFLTQAVTPRYRRALLELANFGGADVVVGRDGWLHYGPDLTHLTAGPFLPDTAAARVSGGDAGEAGDAGMASRTPADPVTCIVDLRDQLAERGVSLLVLPLPPKSSWYAGTLGVSVDTDAVPGPGSQSGQVGRESVSPLVHPDTSRFYTALDEAGVEVLRADELMSFARAAGTSLYLPRDTHWTPELMEETGRRIAARAARALGTELRAFEPMPRRRIAGRGDLVDMLKATAGSGDGPYPPMDVDLVPVPHRWSEFDQRAPVLMLGDSFTRVFSDARLELGESSGLAEVVGQQLGFPVDRIAQVGGGARGVREALARRAALAPEEGGLEGKRLVVWQFAMRDLSGGAELWEPLELGRPEAGGAVRGALESGPLDLRLRLVETSALRPDFDYETALGLFEYEVLEVLAGVPPGERVWVVHPLQRNWELTDAGTWEPGRRVRLVLERVEQHYDLEQTAWVDDTDAPVSAPLWFAVEERED